MKPNSSSPLDASFRYSIGNDEVCIDSVCGNPQLLLGFDAQVFLAGTLDLRALIHADDADITALLFAPQATVTRQVANLRLRQANGRIRCVKCSYQKSATIAGVTLDLLLEDAKSLPRTLDDAAAMANFRAIMENTDDYIYFKDRNHVFTGASQTLVELCEPAEHWTDLIGQTDYDVFPEAYADIYYKLEKQVFAGVEVAHEVQEYLSNEGRKGWVDNRKYPIRNAAGEIVGLYGIARDITGQRKLESDLLAIANFVAQDHGNGFLDALTEFAVRLFTVDYVHAALLEPEGTSVRVVAGRVDGKPVEPGYVYALTGTPCENVLRLDHRFYADHVQALFPDDHDLQDLNAEAYIGEPITDGNGHAIGLIVMVNRQPMADTPATVAGLRILAEQASTALQRQRSEAWLRKQRETLQLILDFAPIGIWLQDGKGKLGFVNKAFCQATGIPEERFLGVEHYVELIPDEFRPQCLASDAKALASSGVSVTYQRLPFVDGQIHDLQVIKALKRNEAGEPEALIGLSLDVTEQLRQEKLLKASEQRLNEAQSIAKVGHWELDIPTGKLHWSDEIYRILEIEKARFGASYESFLAAIHPEDREAVNAAFAHSLESHLPYGITHRLLMPDGRIRYVREQGETSFKENGQPHYSLGTVQDITELTRVEHELLQERDSTRNILATVEAMIVALDTEGRITLINRKGCQILGYREDELLGQDWFATCLPRSVDVDQVREVFQMALAGNLSGSEYYENPVRARSGEERLIAWHNSTIRDKEGNIIGGLSAGEDITERKQNERELQQREQYQRALLDNFPFAVWLKDTESRFLAVNQGFVQLFGQPKADELIGKNDFDIAPAELAEGYRIDDRAVLASGNKKSVEEEIIDADGTRKWFETYKAPVFDNSGGVVGTVGFARDITESRQAKVALQQRQDMLTRTEGIAHVGSWEWDVVTDTTKWSDELFRIFQRDPAEGAPSFAEHPALYSPEDMERLKDAVNAALNQGTPYELELRAIRRDGLTRVCLARGQVEMDADKRVTHLFGSLQDITERKQAEQALQLAASVFSIAREGIMITDTDGTIIDVNDAFTRITGFGHGEVIGKNPRILSSGLHGPELYAAMWRDLKQEGYWQGEIWNRRKNGEVYAEMQTISTVRGPDGNARQYVSLFSDITSIKEHQKQLEHIAHYDALTSLPNRVLLADRLHQAMAQARRHESVLAVAYLDLDGFKAVNDHHGHEVGDQLLTTVSARMKDSLREGDTLGRIGGDEFVAVLVDLSGVEDSVPMLGRLLAVVAEPMHVGELTLQVSASLGVTFYPQDEDIDADQLQRQADQAMYQAKLAGKNRYHMFDATHDRSVRGLHESLEHIRQALVERQFALYYQPKVNMRTGEVIGAEALIRWQHPQRGLLSPAVFLPVVEDKPLAMDLGEWVIETALAQIEAWHVDGVSIPVSVNVGALQLQHPDFVSRLRTLLSQHPGVHPGELELEILETSALEDFIGVTQVMAACQELGVGFALDDFGTGYSSLTYLKQLPIGLLKIDQSFVRDMLDDPDDLAILEGVLGLATAFRRQVIAEGVETLAHGEMLLRLGCEWAQGYAIARPMPEQDFLHWVSTWDAPPAWKALEPISRDRLPVLFAAVEHRAWSCAMVNYLSGKSDAPPERNARQCRFGHWLNHGGRALLLGEGADHAVDELHREIHRLAAELMTLKRDGRRGEVQTGISELHRLREQLLEHLSELY